MNVTAIIPARYTSVRFEGKPLALIKGIPMIQHVYERVMECPVIERTLVATDDERIYHAVKGFHGEAVMTSSHHQTGTDRLAEVAAKINADIIVNVQGDEPLVEHEMISQAITPILKDPDIPMSTLKVEINDEREIQNTNVVKVVTDLEGYAIYFSRFPVPFSRNSGDNAYFKHIGLYVYRKDFLLRFTNLPQGPLEQAERLEQLRALEHGFKIKVEITKHDTIGVDTRNDLKRVEEILSNRNDGT